MVAVMAEVPWQWVDVAGGASPSVAFGAVKLTTLAYAAVKLTTPLTLPRSLQRPLTLPRSSQ
jgi:hypothetical protein